MSNRSGNRALWVINVDGTGLHQLMNDAAADRFRLWTVEKTEEDGKPFSGPPSSSS